jgi:ketosteroid isomerase-like protein
MSQENVEIVRRVGEVWNESGWRGVIDQGLPHPEVEYHDDPKWPDARSTYGTEALIKRSDEFLEAFGEDASTTTEQVLDAGGDRVVIIFHFSVRGRASGIPDDYRWGFLCRVREGRVTFFQAYLEPHQALAAAGLSE